MTIAVTLQRAPARPGVPLAVPIGAVAVLAALLAAWATTGIAPWEALRLLGVGAAGDVDAVGETLVRAIPLATVGVGAALAFRAGVVNVGGEGQMIAGAVAAALVVTALTSSSGAGAPSPLVWLLALAAGAAGGAAWAVVPAVLAATRDVPEILSTLLVNFVTTGVLTWLLTDTFLSDPDPYVITAQGERIPPRLELPVLVGDTRLHLGLLVALAAVAAASWFTRTPAGFRLDLLGANPTLAAQAGVRVVLARASWLLVSAGFAGLAGAVQLFGISHRLTPGLTGGVGYTGVLVAVLGRARPWWVAVAAVAFAALSTGSEELERAGAPREVVLVVQAVLVVTTAVAIRPRPVAA